LATTTANSSATVELVGCAACIKRGVISLHTVPVSESEWAVVR